MWVTSHVGVILCFFDHLYPVLGGNPISHFFGEVFLGSRQNSTTLEHLIDFLAYLEPKLQVKNQNLAKMSVLTNLDLGWIAPIFCMAITRQHIELESCSNPLSRSLLSIYLVVALHVFSKMIEFCQNVSKISGRRLWLSLLLNCKTTFAAVKQWTYTRFEKTFHAFFCQASLMCSSWLRWKISAKSCVTCFASSKSHIQKFYWEIFRTEN